MTVQLDLFAPAKADHVPDTRKMVAPPTAEQLKVQGMARAEANNIDAVTIARGYALDVALGREPKADGRTVRDGLATADDVAALLERDGYEPLGNAAGRMFAGLRGVWEDTGQRVKSTRPQSHANELRVWRYVHWKSL